MFRLRKYRSRRAEIRRNRPDLGLTWKNLKTPQTLAVLGAVVAFWVLATGIVLLRERMVRPRLGDYVHEDVRSRVSFVSRNLEMERELRQQARDAAPRVYRRLENNFSNLEGRLLSLPKDLAGRRIEELPKDLHLDGGAFEAIKGHSAEAFASLVRRYISALRGAVDAGKLAVLPQEEREQDLQMPERKSAKVQGILPDGAYAVVDLMATFSPKAEGSRVQSNRPELLKLLLPLAEESFGLALAAGMASFTADTLQATHELDRELTAEEAEEASRVASVASARRQIFPKTVLVRQGSVVSAADRKLLADEHEAYLGQLSGVQLWLRRGGLGGMAALLAAAMAAYTGVFQRRIATHAGRAVAVGGLLLAMLLISQLAGLGSGPLLIFGIAPTILSAMILAIAYDQRFALGLGSLQGLLVTTALGEGAGFFMILWLGVLVSCLLLDEVRTRSKPIEVGALAAGAMMLGALAHGAVVGAPLAIIGRDCLYVGAAGLGVGFVLLGILPFIEKAFRITTSMTLLELADMSQPLLRRLAVEAPGTYSHSLQVATLAEAAAEAIGADSLLCRVGAYYHDIGKMNKAEYFCENQHDGRNRHLNLSPSVSLLIILGHVKDGIELAKEYNLPSVLWPVIQQHHGTTLIEYFYHEACKQRDPASTAPMVSDVQYRYPGPKPRSHEAAIVMLADIVESAARATLDPSPSRIEALVHDLLMKRLLDGQFDECDLTFHDLQRIERALVKALMGIYHGRVAYPSTGDTPKPTSPAARSA